MAFAILSRWQRTGRRFLVWNGSLNFYDSINNTDNKFFTGGNETDNQLFVYFNNNVGDNQSVKPSLSLTERFVKKQAMS